MTEREKLKNLLLVIFGVMVITNLVILDVVLLLGGKREAIIPMSVVERVKEMVGEPEVSETEVSETEGEDYRLICQDEISRALATISAAPKEIVKTSYQQTPSYKQPLVIYITLGGGASTTNHNWSYVGGAEGYFDKSNYPGAKKISWEVFLRIKDSNGEANARLYDVTHQVVISNSEILGGGENFTLRSSPALTLLDGNNLYQVQLRTTTGYEAFMDGARIKVDY